MIKRDHDNSGIFYLLATLFVSAFICLVISNPFSQSTSEPSQTQTVFRGLFWVLASSGTLVFFLSTISYLQRLNESLESMVDDMRRLRTSQTHEEALLTGLSENVLLSDTLKSIAFRDKDLKTIEETAMQNIRKGNNETAEWLIEQIRTKLGAEELADKLKTEMKRTMQLSEEEQALEHIKHLESLWMIHDYKVAYAEEAELINKYPGQTSVQKLKGQTEKKRLQHKQELLEKLDEASKKSDHDRSVEILKMLDNHLTPTEAAALQETARDVLKTRLHNMGVQFSLAVTGKEWAKALKLGRAIVKEYPNSRMAEEVREKMNTLCELAEHKKAGGDKVAHA